MWTLSAHVDRENPEKWQRRKRGIPPAPSSSSSPPRPPGFVISRRRDLRSFAPACAPVRGFYSHKTREPVRFCEDAGNSSNWIWRLQFTQLLEQRRACTGEGSRFSVTRLPALLFRLGWARSCRWDIVKCAPPRWDAIRALSGAFEASSSLQHDGPGCSQTKRGSHMELLQSCGTQLLKGQKPRIASRFCGWAQMGSNDMRQSETIHQRSLHVAFSLLWCHCNFLQDTIPQTVPIFKIEPIHDHGIRLSCCLL